MLNLTKIMVSLVLGFLCLVGPVMPSVAAVSLWSDTGAVANMYGDRKARAVGDLITVIVNETSSANRVGKSDNTKTSNTNVSAGAGIFSGIKDASAGNNDNFQAKGSITNSNNLNARITAQVIDVQPNGNLIISGMQSVKQYGEEQRITLSGIVRIDDITVNNTVLSSLLGNAYIKVDGHGPIASKEQQGMISQIFNFLF